MRFIISRTSGSFGEGKPCDEAFKDKYIRVDVRYVDCPTKVPAFVNNPETAKMEWYGEGENHRVENGKIKRDIEDTTWFIEINSLEELLHFMSKSEKEIILGKSYWNENIPEIEIYDSYRE